MKISVITVCYNSSTTIEQTIQSVVDQNYRDLEYIIIDGGSTDGTLGIIAKYQQNISECISEPDNGIYDAMNKGLEKCTGDIVAFLNSDDWYERNILEKVNLYFENTNADMVSGNIYLHSADGQNHKIELDRENKENIFYQVIYPQPALFVRKDFFGRMGGFDTSYKIAADAAWLLNACANGAKILCVEDYFTYFREGGISNRRKYEALREQYKAALTCAQGKNLEYVVKKIEDYYSDALGKLIWEQKFADAMNNNISEVKNIFDYQKDYYIWGAGIRGYACLDLFTRLEIPVLGFIDQDPDKKNVEGYPMIPITQISRNCCICITPKGYEKDIKGLLIKHGMDVNDLLVYSDLLEQISELGRFNEE